MAEFPLIATSPDWFRATAWTIGMPVVVALVVIGTFAIAQRYSALVAGASPTVSPFNALSRERHPRLVKNLQRFLILSFFLPLELKRWPLYGILGFLAGYLLGWSLWCLISKRADDLRSRVYCTGLIALAGGISLFLYGLHQLSETA